MSAANVILTGIKVWTTVKPVKRFKAWRARRKAAKQQLTSEGLVEEPATGEEVRMGKYSKAIGAIIGGLIGILVIRFPLLAAVIPDGFADQAAVWLGSLIGTYFAPANK